MDILLLYIIFVISYFIGSLWLFMVRINDGNKLDLFLHHTHPVTRVCLINSIYRRDNCGRMAVRHCSYINRDRLLARLFI